MKMLLAAIIIFILKTPMKAQPVNATSLLKKSMEAMGGESLLKSLSSVHYTARGHESMIEQSERQEPPYMISYFTLAAEKNYSRNKCLYSIAYAANQRPYKLLVDNEKVGAMVGKNYFPMYPETDEQLYLSPERILYTASNARASYAGDSTIQGLKHHILYFKWRDNPVRLFINSQTLLPAAVEVVRYYTSNFNYVWGDTRRLTLYSFWHLENNGLHYPYQSDVFVNRMHFRTLTLDSIRFNLPLGVDTLNFPDSSYAKMQVMQKMIDPLQKPVLTSKEILPGIYQAPGNWNVEFIATPAGIVVLDAPISSVYSQAVLEHIKTKLPDQKIKALITTSSAWPHLGGIRSYAAQNIPIYGLQLNKEIVNQMLNAKHTIHPDELSQKKKASQPSFISKRTVLEFGSEKIELIPMFTETGERMMMVYFPSRKLLYTSDMVQPGFKGGFFMKQYLSEVNDVVKREGIEVDHIFGLHLPLTTYDKFLEVLK